MNCILKVLLSLHWLKARKQTSTFQAPSQKKLIASLLLATFLHLFCFFRGALHFPLLWQYDQVKKKGLTNNQNQFIANLWLNLRKALYTDICSLCFRTAVFTVELVLIILPKHYTDVSGATEISIRPTNSTFISACHSNYSWFIMLKSWKMISLLMSLASRQQFMISLFKGRILC